MYKKTLPHTVSWSKTIFAWLSRFGNNEILSRMGETNDGSSPKCCLVLTFLVWTTKREEKESGKSQKKKKKERKKEKKSKGRTLSIWHSYNIRSNSNLEKRSNSYKQQLPSEEGNKKKKNNRILFWISNNIVQQICTNIYSCFYPI